MIITVLLQFMYWDYAPFIIIGAGLFLMLLGFMFD